MNFEEEGFVQEYELLKQKDTIKEALVEATEDLSLGISNEGKRVPPWRVASYFHGYIYNH